MRRCLLLGLFMGALQLTAQPPVADTVIHSVRTAPAGQQPIEPGDAIPPQPAPEPWIRNGHQLDPDSISAFQRTADLAYLQSFDSLLRALKNQQQAVYHQEPNGGTPSWLEKFFNARLTLLLFWGTALLFAGYIIYQLLMSGLFRRKTRQSVAVPHLPGGSGDNHPPNWQQQAVRLAEQGAYRMAVRALYLFILQDLNERGAISITADKTNARFLSELSGTALHGPVAEIFRYYEYSWYGDFRTDALIFQKVNRLVSQVLREK